MPVTDLPHPGFFIRANVIDPLGLSVSAAAKVLKVSRPTLSSLLNAKADLSCDMALRLEKAFGVDMETLIRLQGSYEIARARRRKRTIHVSRYEPAQAVADTAGR